MMNQSGGAGVLMPQQQLGVKKNQIKSITPLDYLGTSATSANPTEHSSEQN